MVALWFTSPSCRHTPNGFLSEFFFFETNVIPTLVTPSLDADIALQAPGPEHAHALWYDLTKPPAFGCRLMKKLIKDVPKGQGFVRLKHPFIVKALCFHNAVVLFIDPLRAHSLAPLLGFACCLSIRFVAARFRGVNLDKI